VSTDAPPLLIIVSGMSGSGKSVTLKTLEDLGFYCVDNLPAELLPAFVRSVAGDDGAPGKLAVGIDVRNRHSDLASIPEWLSAVGAMGLDPRLVFFDTQDTVLLRRYADTRRRHPLSHLGLVLADAISLERQVLKPLRRIADSVIDTSALNVHQLRRTVITEFGLGGDEVVESPLGEGTAAPDPLEHASADVDLARLAEAGVPLPDDELAERPLRADEAEDLKLARREQLRVCPCLPAFDGVEPSKIGCGAQLLEHGSCGTKLECRRVGVAKRPARDSQEYPGACSIVWHLQLLPHVEGTT